MKDIKLRTDELMGLLARKIPGFDGYLERTERRQADRLQREALGRAAAALKARVRDVQEDLLKVGDMKLMGRLSDTNNRLDRIGARLLHANQGYSGFFDQHQIDATHLTAIYEFDLSLHDNLEKAEAACATWRQNPGGPALAELEQGVQELDAKLDERERLLRGVS